MPIYIGNCARYFIFLMPGDKLAYSPNGMTRSISLISLPLFLPSLCCLFPVTIATCCEGIVGTIIIFMFERFLPYEWLHRQQNLAACLCVLCFFAWIIQASPLVFSFAICIRALLKTLIEILSHVDPYFARISHKTLVSRGTSIFLEKK